MRKTWLAFLSLALCLTLCASAGAGATLKPVGTFPFTDGPAELSVWAQASSTIMDINTNGMTDWYEKYTGVHVNWTVATTEVATKLNLSLASGEYPDVYMAWLTPAQVMLNANSGVFIPLNDLIESDTYYLKDIIAGDDELRKNITAPDGNIYSLFRTDAGVHMLCWNKMFVYQPWLDAYTAATGKGMPATTQEYADMLAYFGDNDMNGNGQDDEIPLAGSYSAWAGDPFAFLCNPFQLWNNNFMLAEDGAVSFIGNTDGFRDALKYVNGLYEKGLLAEETYVQDVTQLKTLVNHKDAKDMVVGCFPTAHVAQYTDLELMPNALVDFAPVPPLEGPTGLRQAESAGGSQISLYGAITSSCKDPALAMRWIDGLSGGPGFEAEFYGFEGQQFKWSDQPSISGVTPSRTLTFDERPQNEWWYYSIGPWYDTIEWRYIETNVYGWYGWAHYRAHDAYKDYYKNVGFPMIAWSSDEDVAAELSELKTQIDTFVKQSYTQFILGVQDIDDDAAWDSYKAQLDAMGLARYLELTQQVNFGK